MAACVWPDAAVSLAVASLGLALVADFRIAAPEARFSANFVKLGFHPGFSLTYTLPRLIGQQKANLMFYTGRRIGGEEAVAWGMADVLVLNDPDSLSHAMNKLYFQSFPREVRAETLITRKPEDIKKFARKHGGKVVLKPLQGSGGQGVFLVNAKTAANLNQMIDAISRDGYVIAQSYVKEAEKGDIRFFLMNGRPLTVEGKYAAMRRVSSKDDIRSNIHAGGKAVAVKISERELRVAELIRPKLLADGMFLVGIDIIGDTILEVNVFSPGNLQSCSDMAGVNFATAILESIERKVQIALEFPGQFSNQALAVM